MPFGIQPIHILIVVIVALLIFGPSKLPEMGRGLGRAITEFRKGTQEMASSFKDELNHASDGSANQQNVMPVAPPPQQVAPPPQPPASPAGVQTCPQCQSQNPAEARFCNHCGASLPLTIN